jgi:hypothetical protein
MLLALDEIIYLSFPTPTLLIVIPHLEKINSVGGHAVNQVVLPRNSPAPTTGILMSQRLGLADPCGWIGENRLNKFERFQRRLPVVLDPPSNVFPKFWKEVDATFDFGAHGHQLLLLTGKRSKTGRAAQFLKCGCCRLS